MQVEATTTIEIEISLSGSIQPRQSQTHNDPGHDAFSEDVTVEDFGGVVTLPRAGLMRRWKTVSFLKGVDCTQPDVIRLLNNIREFLGDDADDALLEAGL